MNHSIIHNKELAKCIVFIAVLFAASIFLGYWLALLDPQGVREKITGALSPFESIRKLNVFLIFLFIFLNNAIKGFLIILLGSFFGIIPAFFVFINGELLGQVLGISVFAAGPGKVLLGILPHGILEIPAIILSAGYGLWIGYKAYRAVRYREPFKKYLFWAIKKFLHVMLPLFFVAALIEAFITPYVISLIE